METVLIDKDRNVYLPKLGYGTGTAWYQKDKEAPVNQELVETITKAIALGYTQLDTAETYNTERETGLAIKASGIPREKLFVTTKVFSNLKNPVQALNSSLEKMQLDYVDLYLIHAPFFDTESHGISHADAWGEMDKIYKSGKAKSVGISNFRAKDIEEVVSFGLVKPSVNQIEYHPYLQQDGIVEECKKHGITVQAYGPLCSLIHAKGGPIDSVVEEIALKHNKTSEQVLLRWSIQKGNVPVTTSSKEDRLKQYLDIFNFSLSQDEENRISEEGKKKEFRKFWTTKEW